VEQQMTITPEQELQIRRLYFAEHWPIGTIARQIGVHDEVVRRVAGLLSPRRRIPNGALANPRPIIEYLDFIAGVLQQYPTLRATRVFDMARERGYRGSLRTLRTVVAELRPRPRHEAFLRSSVLAGEQAQFDWAHAGTLPVDGGTRPLWLFLGVLSWSRGMWGEFVFDLTAPALARSLCRFVDVMGGTPREWLFDNARVIVLERRGEAIRFHPQLLAVASHHRVQPRLCAPRRANEKGRVERTIRFVRERFLAGRTLHSLDEANASLRSFIDDIAHVREHPTLAPSTVADCLVEEKKLLLSPPDKQFAVDVLTPVVVDKTAFVRFDTNSYSVPARYARQTLMLSASDTQVRVLDKDDVVAVHDRCWGRRRVIEDFAHRREILDEKRAARDSRGRERMLVVAPRIGELYRLWADRGRNLGNVTWRVQQQLDLYGHEVFRAAVDDVADRNIADPAAIGAVCARLRKKGDAVNATVLHAGFADYVDDKDVIHHDLESFDAPRRH
jgi:transposase